MIPMLNAGVHKYKNTLVGVKRGDLLSLAEEDLSIKRALLKVLTVC